MNDVENCEDMDILFDYWETKQKYTDKSMVGGIYKDKIMDQKLKIWSRGYIPFYVSIPLMCWIWFYIGDILDISESVYLIPYILTSVSITVGVVHFLDVWRLTQPD